MIRHSQQDLFTPKIPPSITVIPVKGDLYTSSVILAKGDIRITIYVRPNQVTASRQADLAAITRGPAFPEFLSKLRHLATFGDIVLVIVKLGDGQTLQMATHV